jgi:hypothetical protein
LNRRRLSRRDQLDAAALDATGKFVADRRVILPRRWSRHPANRC